MNKIYGYKEKDVKNLYAFLKENEEKSLSDIFYLFGEKTGKSKGTVRNLYYAMAKKSREDKSFRGEFTGGDILTVKTNEKFKSSEEKELLDKIFALKAQGMSVRSAVNALSGGDMKLALRYQNKYRNAMKKKGGKSVRGAAALLKKIRPDITLKPNFEEEYIIALKNEINGLYDRLLSELKKENEYLRKKVATLEKGKLAAIATQSGAISFFKKGDEDELVN